MANDSEPEPTRLESAEEILKAIEAKKAKPRSVNATPGKASVPVAMPVSQAAPVADAQRQHPVERPPMALLCVLDDFWKTKLDGEWHRLRAERTSIGRTEADILIGHDLQISRKHAEIVRKQTPLGYSWILRDLESSGGTFVRIRRTLLRNNDEILLGSTRFRLVAPTSTLQPETLARALSGGAETILPNAIPRAQLGSVPNLVEIVHNQPQHSTPLTRTEYTIGTITGSKVISRPEDPFLDGEHAKLTRGADGNWRVENLDSLNGLWFRIKEMPLSSEECYFRIGEQIFLFRDLRS